MTQIPYSLLTAAEVMRQFRAGYPFQSGEHQMDNGNPDPTTQEEAMHDSAVLQRNVTAAVMKPIGLWTPMHARGEMCRIAITTTHPG